MTFLTPLFLLAAAAAIIPIVLHMINRQKAKDLPFATLRFLKISAQKTRRRKRVHDMLLMLLRMAALALIAVGLAGPTVTNLSRLWSGGGSSAVAIVLDNSASMGVKDPDRTRFETAVRAARQILDELQEGDQVALLLTCGPQQGRVRLDHDRAQVVELLDQCQPSYEKADLGVKLRQARGLLADSEIPNKQIYVLTDLQKLSWETFEQNGAGDSAPPSSGNKSPAPPASDDNASSTSTASPTSGASPAALAAASGSARNQSAPPVPAAGSAAKQTTPPAADGSAARQPSLAAGTAVQTDGEPVGLDIPVIIVDCNRAPKPNVAITGVAWSAPLPVTGMPITVSVELLNESPKDAQRLVELWLDDQLAETSPDLQVPASARLKHDFQFTFKQGGVHRGEVRLVGQDGSALDDKRFFAMEIDQEIPVAVVKPEKHEIAYLEESFYLEQALTPARSGGWAIQTTSLVAGDLLSEPLGNFKVVFCVNIPAPAPDAAARLGAYVERGGHLVWICGDNVDVEAYNLMNQRADDQLLPCPLAAIRAPEGDRDSWHIAAIDKKHPALRILAEPASLYESVLVYRHVGVAAKDHPGVRVLAQLDDGEALLVERSVGSGKVLFLGTSAHIGWSNLPLRPVFLPLVTRLTFDLAGAGDTQHSLVAGTPLAMPVEDVSREVGVEVVPPNGETIRLKTEDDGNGRQVFRYGDTHQVGVYRLRLLESAGAKPVAYSVNFDAGEADPAKIEREALRERFGQTPVVFAEDADDLTSTFAWLREGKNLWPWFLAGVLVVLVFETLISNRLSQKPEEEQGPQPPPGMRRLAKQGAGSRS